MSDPKSPSVSKTSDSAPVKEPDSKQPKEGPSIVGLYLKNLHRLPITQPDV